MSARIEHSTTVHVNTATLRKDSRDASHSFSSLSGLMETETLLDLIVGALGP